MDIKTDGSSFITSSPKFECPIHGVINHAISSSISGHEGHWCQICFLEMLDRQKVRKVNRIP